MECLITGNYCWGMEHINGRPTRRGHRLPQSVYGSASHAFSFTICAVDDNRPFADAALAQAVIDSLLWTRTKYEWRLFVYCLMPDHLHFVGRLKQDSSELVNLGARGYSRLGVLEQVARFKTFTTNAYWRLGFAGKLWQRSSYDHLVDDDKTFASVVEYVLNNPVRAGLATQPQDWPYARIVDPL